MELNKASQPRNSRVFTIMKPCLVGLLYLTLVCPKAYTAQIGSWIFEVDSCASGLSAQIDSLKSPTTALYLGDQNCLGKLKAFSVSDKSFYPKKGSEFLTWTPGSTAVFTNQSKDYDVQVTEQLPETIGNSNKITYQIFDKEQESVTHSVGSFSIGNPSFIQKTPGTPSFNFVLKGAQIKNVNVSSQSLGLVFELECTLVMTQNGTCIKAPLRDLSYALIETKYRGLPCKSGDPTTCWNIIKNQNNPPILAKQPSSNYKGGFESAAIDTLHSPFKNPRYLLMVGNPSEVWILPVTFIGRSTF